MKDYTYPAIIYYLDEDDLLYVVWIPDFDIIVEAETENDAIKRAKNFMNIFIETAIENELDIPEPGDIQIYLKDVTNGKIIILTTKV